MRSFCVIVSNSLSSYERWRVASCEQGYDRWSENILYCFFFCCHLPGTCHSLSKHSWQIHMFHYRHLRNSIIQWMRKHSKMLTCPMKWHYHRKILKMILHLIFSLFFFLPPGKPATCSALLGYIYWSILQVLHARNMLLVIHSIFQFTTLGVSYLVWCTGFEGKGQYRVSPQPKQYFPPSLLLSVSWHQTWPSLAPIPQVILRISSPKHWKKVWSVL